MAQMNNLMYVGIWWTVFCFTYGAQDKFVMLLQPSDIQEMWRQGEVCCEEFGYPVSGLKDIFKWPVPDERTVKLVYHCGRQKTGYGNERGEMIVEKYLGLKLLSGTRDQIADVIRECNKAKLEDPAETAYAAGVCLHKYCAIGIQNENGSLDLKF